MIFRSHKFSLFPISVFVLEEKSSMKRFIICRYFMYYMETQIFPHKKPLKNMEKFFEFRWNISMSTNHEIKWSTVLFLSFSQQQKRELRAFSHLLLFRKKPSVRFFYQDMRELAKKHTNYNKY